MPTPFASLEHEVNQAIVTDLANKTIKVYDKEVDGIFLNDYDEVGFVESSNPAFVARSSDLVDVEHDMEVYGLDGSKYRVVGIKPDGTGMTILELHVEWRT